MKENINELINKLADTRDSINLLDAEKKELSRTKQDLESRLVAVMDDQGIEKTANDRATISVKTETMPSAEDWDQIYKHILATEQFELLHRRLSAQAFRELLSLGMTVPGIKSTDVIRINYRTRT
jgi:hypothetical protein|tara:strand:+ start:306 stop:680 length:375 start_codon:yes stop_codon:yes gene_type:complete